MQLTETIAIPEYGQIVVIRQRWFVVIDVAATRARDTLTITSFGVPSEFLG